MNFLQTDAGKISDEILIRLENAVNEPLYPGDERRIFGEALTLVVLALFDRVNDACKQKMLRYARGEVLDALGENRMVYRMEPTPAVCQIRFSSEEPAERNVIIPGGTRVTSDYVRFFATDKTVVLYAGQSSVTVSATSTEGGEQYNGIGKGKIKGMAESIPGVDFCENLDVTHSGGDREEDDAYRLRIREAENMHSTAGAESTYRFYAMAANPLISDVAVISEDTTITQDYAPINGHVFFGGADLKPETLLVDGKPWTDWTYKDCLLDVYVGRRPSVTITLARSMAGWVKIVPICAGGTLPDTDVLQDVLNACNAEDVRPMSDYVVAEAPEVVPYDIELTYWCQRGKETEVIKNVEGAGGAIVQYNAWQDSSFMPSINPDKLRQLILCPHDENGQEQTGAYRVEIKKPVFQSLQKGQIAKWSGTAVIQNRVGEG